MASKNFIPRNENQFSEFLCNLLMYVDQNATKWKHIPADRITILSNLNDAFSDLLNSTSGPRNAAQNLARREAQAEATKELRGFVNQYLRFAPVTNVDRVEMGIPNRDTIPTTIPPPTIPVTGVLSFPSIGLVEMREIRAQGDKSDVRAKHGVRIYYGIMGEPSETNKFRIAERPKTGDDLPHSVFTRRSRQRFDFASERGREVFFCMRFENSKGEVGPWGKIISGFIP